MTIKEIFENLTHSKNSMIKLDFIYYYIYFLEEFFETDNKLEMIDEEPLYYNNIPNSIYSNCAFKIEYLSIINKIKVPDWIAKNIFKSNNVLSIDAFKYRKEKEIKNNFIAKG